MCEDVGIKYFKEPKPLMKYLNDTDDVHSSGEE